MTTFDIALRLLAATLIGGALGLNRDLHDKPTGVRTLALVGLGSALAVTAVAGSGDFNPISRVIQGIVTGIGFLGAGVIIRPPHGTHRIHGLTTAACTWLTAAIGSACAVAEWRAVIVSLPLILIVLTFGGRFEKAVRRYWDQEPDSH